MVPSTVRMAIRSSTREGVMSITYHLHYSTVTRHLHKQARVVACPLWDKE